MRRYASKTQAELLFIVADAGEAAKCARDLGNAGAEGKYLNQVSDAASEMSRRRQRGSVMGATATASASAAHFTDRACASPGLVSYRCRGAFGWIMIGASGDSDAMKQARRSSEAADEATLEVWNGQCYVSATSQTLGEIQPVMAVA